MTTKPQRCIPDGAIRTEEFPEERRDRLVRELRDLHAMELAQAYEQGKRDGIAEAGGLRATRHARRVFA